MPNTKKSSLSIQYNSPVILTYAIISLIVLIVGVITSHSSTRNFFMIYPTSLSDPLLYFRIFGHVLGHADFNHYFSNFYMMLLIGPMIEEKYGSKNLLIMMLVTAFISGVIHIMFFTSAALGASGIVFMLILLTPFTNMKKGKIPLTFILVSTIFIGREVFYGLTVVDNISRFGHILGGTSGAIMGFIVNKKGAY